MRKRQAAYWTDAAQWIALNDDPAEMDVETIAGSLTVVMAADIFNRDADEIARHIVTLRNIQVRT